MPLDGGRATRSRRLAPPSNAAPLSSSASRAGSNTHRQNHRLVNADEQVVGVTVDAAGGNFGLEDGEISASQVSGYGRVRAAAAAVGNQTVIFSPPFGRASAWKWPP